MDTKKFTDNWTLDGLVIPPRSVTREKVSTVAKYVAEGKRGNRVSEARLTEALMSGDLASSVAHFINLITIPQLPDLRDRPVYKIAGQRSVPDFRPATLFSIFGKLEGPGITEPGPDLVGSAPRVPQGSPYPVATIAGRESAYGKLQKRGLRVNWDFEDFVNDTIGVLDGIPSELATIALQTEWREVGDALLNATTQLDSQTLPEGVVEPANATVSAKSILGAIHQLAISRIHGSLIGTLSGYNVIVPIGTKVYVEYSLRVALGIFYALPQLSTGGPVTVGPDHTILNSVEIIEHESVTGTNWYLLPKPGAYVRPILDVLNLRGYEQPQIRARAGGDEDAFSFDTDSAALRLRLVTGAALWFQEAVIHSTGVNAAV